MADNIAKANEYKTLGNKEFQANNYEAAIEHFTKAIELNPNDHLFYSNRSACYASIEEYERALEDADICVSQKPDWAKGYTRKGLAEFYLGKLDESIQTYRKGLQLEPDNSQLREGLQRAEEEKANGGKKPQMNEFQMQMLTKLMGNPKTREYLNDPDFVRKLQLLQTNPQMIQVLLNSDPRFKEAFGVIFGGASDFSPEPQTNPQPTYTEPNQKKEEQKPKQEEKKQENISESQNQKNIGNEYYKKKEFEKAIEHYNKAIELEPTEVLFWNNKAAVLIEQQKYKETIQLIDQAIQKCDELEFRMPYEKLAKLLARKASAYAHLKDYDQAIKFYEKALLEDQNPKFKDELKKIVRQKKIEEEQSYINPTLAEEHKQKGNTLFKEGKFPDAFKEYSEAIKRNPSDPVLYSNRAQALVKLLSFSDALKDIEKSIELQPNLAKTWARKGNIHFSLKEFHKALESYEKGLKLDPDNSDCKDGITKTKAQIFASSGGEQDEERVRHAMADPEIQKILREPEIVNLLNDMKERPNAPEVQSALKKPDIAEKLNKLIAAGVIRIG